MPRYYFEIEDGVCIPDEIGLDLKDDAAARHEARMMCDELKEERKHGEPLRIRVIKETGEEEVVDGSSQGSELKSVRN
jgi:hypothetical protein